MKKDYYETLGVSKTATDAEIKSAFRKKAKTCHPDVNKSPDAEKEFKALGEAYAVLSDPEKRKQYDAYGHEAYKNASQNGGFGGGFAGGFQGFDPGDIDVEEVIREFFGGRGSSRNRSNGPRKGDDAAVLLNLTFDEAVHGCKKEITIDVIETCESCKGQGGFDEVTCSTCGGRGKVIVEQNSLFGFFQTQTTCRDCKGTGKIYKRTCDECRGTGNIKKRKTIEVTIPSGVDHGHQLRISGKGSSGINGGPNGDIYIEFNVGDSKIFTRDEFNLFFELPINIVEAALGCKKEIPTLDKNVYLEVKPGTQNGTKLKLRDKGVKDPNSNYKGDMYVIVKVITPTKLNRRQKELLEELKDSNLDDESEIKNYQKNL